MEDYKEWEKKVEVNKKEMKSLLKNLLVGQKKKI